MNNVLEKRLINQSLSYQESDAIKGILIFLVILGHNRFFSTVAGSEVWNYLYTFHVYGFFILPFFYPEKGIDTNRIKNNSVKLLYVYVVWFLAYSVIFILASKVFHLIPISETGRLRSPIGYIVALITGAPQLLSETCGFQVLWFLPVMFSMLLLKGVREKYRMTAIVPFLIIAGIISYIFFIDFRYRPPYPSIVTNLLDVLSPLAFFRGIGAFAIGYITFKLAKYFSGGGGEMYAHIHYPDGFVVLFL